MALRQQVFNKVTFSLLAVIVFMMTREVTIVQDTHRGLQGLPVKTIKQPENSDNKNKMHTNLKDLDDFMKEAYKTHKTKGYYTCSELFTDFKAPPELQAAKGKLDTYLRERQKQHKENIIGTVGSYIRQELFYFQIARAYNPKTICEVGFNAGHSSLIWLTAVPDAKLYSYDIDDRYYTRYMADFVSRLFPGRFDITWGDSLKAVPFQISLGHPKCDLISIDGAHTYRHAKQDVLNFQNLANSEGSLILFDDYSKPHTPHTRQPLWIQNQMRKAWDEVVGNRTVLELFNCWFPKGEKLGFAVGKYNLSENKGV